MYYPNSFTKEIAQELHCSFNKIGTDCLVGISSYSTKQVYRFIEMYIESTQDEWEDPIVILEEDNATSGDIDVYTMSLSCEDGDDNWQVVLAQLDYATLVCFKRS